jgi:hypothetical protein
LFNAKIIADSVAPDGTRLTTMEITYPRIIHGEVMTHRVFSRNSASSRAIPTELQIQKVKDEPFVPEHFGSKKKGMAPGPSLNGWKEGVARRVWKSSRWAAIGAVRILDKLGVHKSYASRLLEPWMWNTLVVTSTTYDNFFYLRIDPDAQGEIQTIAELMKAAYDMSVPKTRSVGEWHLPYITAEDYPNFQSDPLAFPKISAGRCARVSYDNTHKKEKQQESIQRAQRMLTASKVHWSPFEHQARVMESVNHPYNANFQGQWGQLRAMLENE